MAIFNITNNKIDDQLLFTNLSIDSTSITIDSITEELRISQQSIITI